MSPTIYPDVAMSGTSRTSRAGDEVNYLLRCRGSVYVHMNREMQPDNPDDMVNIHITQPEFTVETIYRTYEAAESVMKRQLGMPPTYLSMSIEEIPALKKFEQVKSPHTVKSLDHRLQTGISDEWPSHETWQKPANQQDPPDPRLAQHSNKKESSCPKKPLSNQFSEQRINKKYPQKNQCQSLPPQTSQESKKFPERLENEATQIIPRRPQADRGPTYQSIGFLASNLAKGTRFTLMVQSAIEGGMVVSTLPDSAKSDYKRLANLEAPQVPYMPGVNEVVSVQTEHGRYRATRADSTWALLDEGYFSFATQPGPLPPALAHLPAFACVLRTSTLPLAPGKVFWATVLDKNDKDVRVRLEPTIKRDREKIEGRLSLWVPTCSEVAELHVKSLNRVKLEEGSEVILMTAENMGKVQVRSAADADRRQYDALVMDIGHEAVDAPVLKRPPSVHSVVVAPFGDDGMFRAMVIANLGDTCKVVFLDLGVQAVVPVQTMREPGKRARGALLVHRLRLANTERFTPSAVAYVTTLAERRTKMRLTSLGPAGAVLVGEQGDLARRLTQLSTPRWQSLQERGRSLLTLPAYMTCDLEYVRLKLGDTLVVRDYSMLRMRLLSCAVLDAAADELLKLLSVEIKEYCEQTSGPYMPRPHEVCMAKFTDGCWYRAAAIKCQDEDVLLMFLDYGNSESVHFSDIRKGLSEHIEFLPALAPLCHLAGFPTELSPKLQERTLALVDAYGALKPTAVEVVDVAQYLITLPWLLRALQEEGLLPVDV